MPAQCPHNPHEILERLARDAVADEITVEWTDEVATHAPVVGLPEQRTELFPEVEEALRRWFDEDQ